MYICVVGENKYFTFTFLLHVPLPNPIPSPPPIQFNYPFPTPPSPSPTSPTSSSQPALIPRVLYNIWKWRKGMALTARTPKSVEVEEKTIKFV